MLHIRPFGVLDMIRFLAACLITSLCWANPPDAAHPSPTAPAIPRAHKKLEHLFEVSPGLFSGGAPEGDAAFDALVDLGIKVIISVDGAPPDIALAKARGLRTIHLPIGYDGLPAHRIAELLHAAETASGPIYVHCHHGKHRGPAAAAAICQGVKGWNPNQAVTWLKQAGTGEEYSGLYRDTQNFKSPDAATRARVPANLPEVAATTPIVDCMVAIDDLFALLKKADARDWATPKPEKDPASHATLLLEQFREAARLPVSAARGADYMKLLDQAADSAARLQQLCLKAGSSSADKHAEFLRVSESCATCHRSHRN